MTLSRADRHPYPDKAFIWTSFLMNFTESDLKTKFSKTYLLLFFVQYSVYLKLHGFQQLYIQNLKEIYLNFIKLIKLLKIQISTNQVVRGSVLKTLYFLT